MKVCNQLHTPTIFTSGEEGPIPVDYTAGCAAQALLDLWGRRKHNLSITGNVNRFV